RSLQRLHRVSQPHAGAWVTAVPSDEDGFQTILRPKNFRTAAAYRLGVVVLKGDIPCPMCTQTIDKLGDHATCCSKGWGPHRSAQQPLTVSAGALETSRPTCGPRVRASQSTSQSLPVH